MLQKIQQGVFIKETFIGLSYRDRLDTVSGQTFYIIDRHPFVHLPGVWLSQWKCSLKRVLLANM